MIARKRHLAELTRLLRQFPVVGLIGPRQVGKSTLARLLADEMGGATTAFDLEDSRALAKLAQPLLALEPLRGLVVLDEVQRRPEIFPALRVLADRPRRPARFLVLGSASPDLLRQSSESLAGRIAYHHLPGLDLSEVAPRALDRLWVRGGFPLAFTARTEAQSLRWRREFVRTFVERDLAALGIGLAPTVVERFWTMLAHFHGQVWNAAELARAFGASEKTMRHYLDVLVSTFMVRRLRPWFANIGKREVKAPKVYVSDSGLLHGLLGIADLDELSGHPKVGASWEGFAIEQIVRQLRADGRDCYFWGVHTGGELDLLVVRGKSRLGFEVKRTDSPRVTPSMRSALAALALDRLDVVHAGTETFRLGDRIRALALSRVLTDLRP